MRESERESDPLVFGQQFMHPIFISNEWPHVVLGGKKMHLPHQKKTSVCATEKEHFATGTAPITHTHTHTYLVEKRLQERDEIHQFTILLVDEPTLDGDAVGQLYDTHRQTVRGKELMEHNMLWQLVNHIQPPTRKQAERQANRMSSKQTIEQT